MLLGAELLPGFCLAIAMYSSAKIEEIVSNRCWIEGEYFQLKLNASFWVISPSPFAKIALFIKSLILLLNRYILTFRSIKVQYSFDD